MALGGLLNGLPKALTSYKLARPGVFLNVLQRLIIVAVCAWGVPGRGGRLFPALCPAFTGSESEEISQLFGVAKSERGGCCVCKHFLSELLRVNSLHQQIGKIRHALNDGAEETAMLLVGLAIKSLQVGQCGFASGYR